MSEQNENPQTNHYKAVVYQATKFAEQDKEYYDTDKHWFGIGFEKRDGVWKPFTKMDGTTLYELKIQKLIPLDASTVFPKKEISFSSDEPLDDIVNKFAKETGGKLGQWPDRLAAVAYDKTTSSYLAVTLEQNLKKVGNIILEMGEADLEILQKIGKTVNELARKYNVTLG